MGTWGLAASIVSMVVGASIFVVPAALADSMGAYAPLAILLCAVAVGCVAVCFAEGGSRLPSSGGAYGYIEAAFGPLTGYVTGTLLWFSDVLACGGIAAALADIVAGLVPPPLAVAAHALTIIVALTAIALINMRGVTHGTRLVNATTLIKLAPLAVFLVAGGAAIHWANFTGAVRLSGHGLGRAVILSLFAFMGMEAALCTSGEVAEPGRTIPRALALAMSMVSCLYIGIQIIVQGILGQSLATSTAPLADAMARVSPLLHALMLAGAALSMLGYLAGDLLGSPRILFAFARDGLLPGVLGRVDAASGAPRVAIVGYTALAMGFALTGTFAELAVLAALGTAAFYIAGCAAAWRLSRRGVALAGKPLNFRWLTQAMVIAIASMVVLISLAARSEIAGLAALIGISAALYGVNTRFSKPVVG